MKKVLVPFATFSLNKTVPTLGHYESDINKLTKYGLLPLFVSPSMSKKQINYLYKECGGIYVTGGADWDPRLYKKQMHSQTLPTEQKRDKLELFILKKAIKDRKPILGICRGCQGIAIASGGELMQHIPQFFPKEIHRERKDAPYDILLSGYKHEVIIEKDSFVYKIMKKRKVLANSYHHQAISNPGNNMKIVAKTKSGVAEAIEHIDKNYFCIGIQSHPEIEENSFFEEIFKTFAASIA